jgi:hypothetical protein
LCLLIGHHQARVAGSLEPAATIKGVSHGNMHCTTRTRCVGRLDRVQLVAAWCHYTAIGHRHEFSLLQCARLGNGGLLASTSCQVLLSDGLWWAPIIMCTGRMPTLPRAERILSSRCLVEARIGGDHWQETSNIWPLLLGLSQPLVVVRCQHNLPHPVGL